jgi:hypothetical protein
VRPPRVDWPALVSLAGWNGLIVSVYPAIEERGLANDVPADVLAALREFHVQAAARRAEGASQIERVSLAMNDAGIEPLWLKGAALIVEDSPWASRRWMSDLDVWVPPSRVEAAQAVLSSLGYAHDPRQPHAAQHHLRPLFHARETFAVELHHALTPPHVAAMMPAGIVLSRAHRMQWRGARVAILASLDQAVHIASQSRMSASTYLHGCLKTRRVVEFAQLASSTGAAEATHALRTACVHAGQLDFAEEFLALAAGLCALPGHFAREGALSGIAWKVTFPRLHSVYSGFRGVGRRGIVYHALHPRRFARTVAAYLRAMDPPQ